MAMADTVNPQITDAVTQANTQTLGNAPASAMGTLYQATAQSLAMAFQNATAAQQNANEILQATTSQGVALLYGATTGSNSMTSK
jgi:hypothetical protein